MSNFEICGDPARRHDFLLVFDVTDGNPNGDPDAGNMPRVDPETMQGLVTDVCLKRKIRNYVAMTQEGSPTQGIYVNDQGIALNTLHQKVYDEAGLKSTGTKQPRKDVDTARDRMCQRYFDVRMFGAVMTTGVNAGQVRGPVQMTFARSVFACRAARCGDYPRCYHKGAGCKSLAGGWRGRAGGPGRKDNGDRAQTDDSVWLVCRQRLLFRAVRRQNRCLA